MRVFYRGVSDAVFLVIGEGDDSIQLIDRLENQRFGMDFVLVEPASTKMYDRLVTQLFGLSYDMLPAAIFAQGSTRFKYLHEGQDITKESLTLLITQGKAGQLPIYYKSESRPDSQDSAVIKVVGKTLKELTQDSEQPILLDIYSPMCGHCKQLEPKYLQAAEELRAKGKDIVLGKIDITKNDVPIVQVTGYPHIVYFGKDKTKPPQTPRIPLKTKEDVISFVNKMLDKDSKTIDDPTITDL